MFWSRNNDYSDSSGSTFGHGLFVVGTSLLFSIGLFLIINAHNSSQDAKLEKTIAAIKKSQEEGIDINTALSEIGTNSNDKKSLSSTADPSPVNANFDSLTVKGSTSATGNISAGGDLNIRGVLSAKNNASVGGDLDVTGDTSIGGDLELTGEVRAGSITGDEASIAGDLSVDGSILVGGEDIYDVFQPAGEYFINDSDEDITTSGAVDAGTLLIGGEDITDIFQAAGDYQEAGDYVVLDSADPQAGNINVDGDITASGALAANSLDVKSSANGNPTILSVSDDGVTIYDPNNNHAIFTLVDDTITFGNTITMENLDSTNSVEITVNGTLDATTIMLGGADITEMFQAAGDYQEAGDYLVSGDDADVGDLTATTVETGLVNSAFGYQVNGEAGANVAHLAQGGACDNSTDHIQIRAIKGGLITSAGCVSDGDDVGVGDVSAYDIAENYQSSQSLEAGDVVSIDTSQPEKVLKSSGSNDKLVIGVVSTKPGITLGKGDGGYAVALAGRVPVKVNDEGGAIVAGDYLTSASTPGYAKKAAPGDKTIGQAMANFSGASGTVVIFVNTSGGNVAPIELVQGTNLAGQVPVVEGDLEVKGSISVVNIQIKGHIIGNDDTRGSVTVLKGETKVHRDFKSAYGQDPIVVASPVSDSLSYKAYATKTGFDIELKAPATEDTVFNYLVQE